ncbi:hypothetical protein ADUPG1_009478 [Aduncisulcus paluster]|uniref:Uncharacterized protein n=1 Tax=Aduncisulcus paluster TaxID=2918883 RepID=A0ABQ5KVP5_9EUKA|nr:hypothetical protein ADUPG1_009478 [Aduncisulcus paluster]|eukprot:gnl/Carplike_NY0171/3363_a4526_383.p1 GENE.gnl/Carplike_NY0171/3363_a4526_383~~gnl/Carplike_NY0171/3363_a4526_383.p1  ORF type:complete len:386 (-),score=67.98 gnl/Carplike_NY0171/3363_a4526_383:619-1776(-)
MGCTGSIAANYPILKAVNIELVKCGSSKYVNDAIFPLSAVCTSKPYINASKLERYDQEGMRFSDVCETFHFLKENMLCRGQSALEFSSIRIPILVPSTIHNIYVYHECGMLCPKRCQLVIHMSSGSGVIIPYAVDFKYHGKDDFYCWFSIPVHEKDVIQIDIRVLETWGGDLFNGQAKFYGIQIEGDELTHEEMLKQRAESERLFSERLVEEKITFVTTAKGQNREIATDIKHVPQVGIDCDVLAPLKPSSERLISIDVENTTGKRGDAPCYEVRDLISSSASGKPYFCSCSEIQIKFQPVLTSLSNIYIMTQNEKKDVPLIVELFDSAGTSKKKEVFMLEMLVEDDECHWYQMPIQSSEMAIGSLSLRTEDESERLIFAIQFES